MTSHCEIGLVAVYCLIFDIFVAPVVTHICITWDTTGGYLTLQCMVAEAKHDIFVDDPFDQNRGQCILRDLPYCSTKYKYDFISIEKLKSFTTLSLKTYKHNAVGEWKCRYGNEEETSYVSYAEGIVPDINIEISGEIEENNGSNSFKLSCFSCWKPHVEGVDIYVNSVLEDTIRYHEDLCYHKGNECRPERCSCSAKGRNFTWNFISDLSYIEFTCVMRFEDESKSMQFIRQADLVYNNSVFIQKKTKTMSFPNPNNTSHNVTTDADNNKQKETGVVAYVILGILFMLILGIFIICVFRICARRKQMKMVGRQGDVENQMDLDESRHLLANHNDRMDLDESSLLEVEDEMDHDESHPPTEIINLQCSQESTSSVIGSLKRNTSTSLLRHCLTKDKNTVSGCIFQTKCIQVICICSDSEKEVKYTSNLITFLQTLSFQLKNISLFIDACPDNLFSQTVTTVRKRIIVIPEECQLDEVTFTLLVKTVGRHFKDNPCVDILPVVPPNKRRHQLMHNTKESYRRLESRLKDAILHFRTTDKNDEVLHSLNTYQNRLNKIVLCPETCKHLQYIALQVLKGWGVEIEKELVCVRLNVLQTVSQYEPICLKDLLTCFVRDTSIRCLRFYGCEQLDFEHFKLHTHIHRQIIRLFKFFFGIRMNVSWYHYRRNGFRRRSSIEEYLKSIFLNDNPSASYQKFSTYESRLRSFNNYPNENKAFREKIAFAGFFYFNISDYVQCFYCKGCLRTWNITDDPMVRHRENFKKCPFVMQSDLKERSEKEIQTTKNYKDFELHDRIISFKSFPCLISKDEVQRLAVAGFFYCGIAMDIVCFACNIGFADPRNSNDILRLHKLYSRDCPNISSCQNHTQSMNTLDQECISNFTQYLEIEVRRHDFET